MRLPILKNVNQIRARIITKWLKMPASPVRWYNLREVQYLAGYRYIGSMESYLQNDIEGLEGEINKYHPLG